MRKPLIAALGAAASLALLAGAGSALAQNRAASGERLIAVPPGAVVLVLPAGAAPMMPAGMFDADFAFPPMPGPGAMTREIQAMMAQAEQAFVAPAWIAPDRTIPAAMEGLPAGPGVSGVFVTSVSDGSGTCTRQVTYGGGRAPRVEMFGNACGASSGSPATLPDVRTPERAARRTIEVRHRIAPALPHLIQADSRSRPAPLQVAQLRE